jgi:hypothetical protein
VGFAGLAGTPITGALINDYSPDGYSHGIIFSAAVMIAGAVVFTFARWAYAPGKLIA